MHASTLVVCSLMLGITVLGQDRLPPRFEDFPAPIGWQGWSVVPRLETRSDAFLRRPILEAPHRSPNFATHYRLTVWSCGWFCLSGAIVDLATGRLIDPPRIQTNTARPSLSMCQSAYLGSGVEVRLNSNLMIVYCGLNYDRQSHRNVPDAYYFVFEGQHFRKLAHLHRNV